MQNILQIQVVLSCQNVRRMHEYMCANKMCMNINVVSNSIVRGASYGKIFELKSASDPFKMQYIVHMHKASLDS